MRWDSLIADATVHVEIMSFKLWLERPTPMSEHESVALRSSSMKHCTTPALVHSSGPRKTRSGS